MALVFHRRLALPVWAMVCTVALAASQPETGFRIAVLGIAVIAFTIAFVPQLRTAQSVVHGASRRQRHSRSAAVSAVAGRCGHTADEANTNTSEDTLDLERLDDDGGWQMARPSG